MSNYTQLTQEQEFRGHHYGIPGTPYLIINSSMNKYRGFKFEVQLQD